MVVRRQAVDWRALRFWTETVRTIEEGTAMVRRSCSPIGIVWHRTVRNRSKRKAAVGTCSNGRIEEMNWHSVNLLWSCCWRRVKDRWNLTVERNWTRPNEAARVGPKASRDRDRSASTIVDRRLRASWFHRFHCTDPMMTDSSDWDRTYLLDRSWFQSEIVVFRNRMTRTVCLFFPFSFIRTCKHALFCKIGEKKNKTNEEEEKNKKIRAS